MKFWLGTTDNSWFEFLSHRRFDEVNFWQPSATPPFKNAPVGLPFLFKLKRPYNHVAGGGFFVAYSKLPITLAWEVFAEKNGANSLSSFRSLVEPLTGSNSGAEIGCTILTNPVFFDPAHWIADPVGWSSNIVRGKMFSTEEPAGQSIWHAIRAHFEEPGEMATDPESQVVTEPLARYGEPVLVKPRLGQGAFRVSVTEAYKRRCAMTGENTLIALEAAHIAPYSCTGDHDITNGLLLRADFHRLFDAGLVSVDPNLRIRVSHRIKNTYFNGKAYYRLDNQPLSVLPDAREQQPDPDRLNWHFRNIFQS
jgi:putative restriction endonuclease